MVIACKNIKEIRNLKLLLSVEFEMKDQRAVKNIFRLPIIRNIIEGYNFLT